MAVVETSSSHRGLRLLKKLSIEQGWNLADTKFIFYFMFQCVILWNAGCLSSCVRAPDVTCPGWNLLKGDWSVWILNRSIARWTKTLSLSYRNVCSLCIVGMSVFFVVPIFFFHRSCKMKTILTLFFFLRLVCKSFALKWACLSVLYVSENEDLISFVYKISCWWSMPQMALVNGRVKVLNSQF